MSMKSENISIKNHAGFGISKNDWKQVRIYWGDNSESNFSKAFHYPIIKRTSNATYMNKDLIVNPFQTNREKTDNQSEQTFFNWYMQNGELKSPENLKERVYFFNNPSFKIIEGEPLIEQDAEINFIKNNITPENKAKETKGIICDQIEQYIIVEVKTSPPILENNLPMVDVWAFLQDHTIGKGPDSRASISEVVIDDDKKSGWFHCLIAPKDSSTKEAIAYQYVLDKTADNAIPKIAPLSIEGRLDRHRDAVTEREYTIPLSIDTRSLAKGIVRYKIKVTVKNDLTPEDNMRRWQGAYQNIFGEDKPESRTIEAGCWLKVWARNAELDWPEEANISDQLNNTCRDSMDEFDPPVYEGHPRTAVNHTWIRNRLFDESKQRPLYVGLYPKDVILALNAIDTGLIKALEQKKAQANNSELSAMDSEFNIIDLFLGMALYGSIMGGIQLILNGDEDKEKKRKTIRKLMDATQFNTVAAAYTVNGYKEGFHAAKTLAAASTQADKKVLFKAFVNIYEFISKLALGEEVDDTDINPDEDDNEENWLKKLNAKREREFNADDTWGFTEKLTAGAKGKRVFPNAAGRPLPGYLSFLSAAGFVGAGAGIDAGLKLAWDTDKKELAVEIGTDKKTGGNFFAGIDIKTLWARAADLLNESDFKEDNIVSVLNAIVKWTNIEASIQAKVALELVSDFKIKYQYGPPADKKTSIWDTIRYDENDKIMNTLNDLKLMLNGSLPIFMQLSGFTMQYSLANLNIAEAKTDEFSLFNRGKLVGEGMMDLPSSRWSFPWAKFRSENQCKLESNKSQICLGEKVEFSLDYDKKQKQLTSDQVHAWRLIKYTPTEGFEWNADEDFNPQQGASVELNPTSQAAFDLDCLNIEDSTGDIDFPHKVQSSFRFTTWLDDSVSASDKDHQIDLSQGSDTYLHFIKEFEANKKSGLKLAPAIRMEGLTDRSLQGSVILKYPKLNSARVELDKNKKRAIWTLDITDFKDDYLALAFSDDQWGVDENLKLDFGNGESHWHRLKIERDENNKIIVPIDLSKFNKQQLLDQMGVFDGSVELYPKLSFICQTDESQLIPEYFGVTGKLIQEKLNKYKPDDFQFHVKDTDRLERLKLDKDFILTL